MHDILTYDLLHRECGDIVASTQIPSTCWGNENNCRGDCDRWQAFESCAIYAESTPIAAGAFGWFREQILNSEASEK